MPAALSADLRSDARKLFLTGHTCVEIAQLLNIKPDTVYRWSQRGGWRLDVQQVKKMAAITVKNVLGRNLTAASVKAREALAGVLESQIGTISQAPGDSISALRNTPEGEGTLSLTKKAIDAAAVLYGWGDEKTVGIVQVDSLRAFDPPKQAESSEAIDVQEVTPE